MTDSEDETVPALPPPGGPGTPAVSVVVPARDDAAHLARCLRLLAAQTRPPDEVVVVDNASSDATAEVARAAGARVVFEPVRGIPQAAAAGYDAARGDVVVRCDADSAPGPEWIAGLLAALDHRADAVAVAGPGRFYGLPPGLGGLLSALYMGLYVLTTAAALAHPPLFGTNMAMRRDWWLEVRNRVHRYDPELHDDLDLSFRLGPGCRILFRPGLSVGMSPRALRGGRPAVRRLGRAFRTIRLNWAEERPWERWRARLGRRAGRCRP
ncbi:glycosyltransferase family A protein [Kocuria rosea]|uniref:glycosyltransferase family A protein n=1 Tax=Kocuria rosea TaxID=1275 RepID=UPI00203FCBCC|nr:glycosyltransferase family A protein [Kocuria rosea]MCM3686908.1 glycosyltransferase family 2 protein [Kocuria rosea]